MEPEKAQFNEKSLDQKHEKKMTASIKDVETELIMTVKTSMRQEVSLKKTRRTKINEPTRKHWKRKRTNRAERQVEKDEDGIVFDRDALMDREAQQMAGVLRTTGAEEAIAETASKRADKTDRKGKKGTWTDATGSKNTPEGALEA